VKNGGRIVTRKRGSAKIVRKRRTRRKKRKKKENLNMFVNGNRRM